MENKLLKIVKVRTQTTIIISVMSNRIKSLAANYMTGPNNSSNKDAPPLKQFSPKVNILRTFYCLSSNVLIMVLVSY